ncbi:hypothetical protein DSL72_001460 [Monilinia vaccinii-corymbosi]|uniref:Nitroreductase domain-containing protein n=1 Tax=Monilinia vaccinii-corymbosi TaxID=61207 RepID=A0A8A3P7T1_9HELO|nr:hypothetical protein DSL72_001460 [Monilinia vaccinii-corymbosi]
MSPSAQFIDLLKSRRTIYALEAKSPISDSRIQEIVEQAILHVPSSFNSQSTRAVLLFKGEHEKLWDITKDVLKGVVPAENFESTAQRIGGFRKGYGTVSFVMFHAIPLGSSCRISGILAYLSSPYNPSNGKPEKETREADQEFANLNMQVLFFEDRKAVEKVQSTYSTYADRFPGWATQSDAMAQYAIWVALEAEGLGANLQHYNPLINTKVAAEWNIPAEWELNAQLVFGTPVAPAGEKSFIPVEERVKVFGA